MMTKNECFRQINGRNLRAPGALESGMTRKGEENGYDTLSSDKLGAGSDLVALL